MIHKEVEDRIEIKIQTKEIQVEVQYSLKPNKEDKVERIDVDHMAFLSNSLKEYYGKEEPNIFFSEQQNVKGKKIVSQVAIVFDKSIRIKQPNEIRQDQSKVLQDLVEQLEEIHYKNLIVQDFDMSSIAYFPDKNKYALIKFPSLIHQDDVFIHRLMFLNKGSRNVRSQFLFQGTNKAIDFLALIKNFMVFIEEKDYANNYPSQIRAVARENIFFNPQNNTVRIYYTPNYHFENIEDDSVFQCLLDISKCSHQILGSQLKIESNLFKKIYEITQNILQQEYYKITQIRCHNALKSREASASKQIQVVMNNVMNNEDDERYLDKKIYEVEQICNRLDDVRKQLRINGTSVEQRKFLAQLIEYRESFINSDINSSREEV